MGITTSVGRLLRRSPGATSSQSSPEQPRTSGNIEVNKRFVLNYIADKWLDFPVTTGPIPTHGQQVIRAMERRGFETFRQDTSVLFFKGDQCVGGFWGVTTGTNEIGAYRVSQSKLLTKIALGRLGIPVPDGQSFPASEKNQARDFISANPEVNFVVKPDDGIAGRGITTGVTLQNFDAAWERAAKVAKTKFVVVEQECPGIDVRVFVVAGEAKAAAARIPPFVYGNGRDSIASLIDQLEAVRVKNNYLDACTLFIDEPYLASQGVDFTTVLGEGEVIFLNGTANSTIGGITYTVTDIIAPELLRLAERIVSGIPGMTVGGIDFLIADIPSGQPFVVTEINADATSQIHLCSLFGEQVNLGEDIAEDIVRRYTASRK